MVTHTACDIRRCFSLPARNVNNGDHECARTPDKSRRGPQGKCLQILAVLAANIISVSFGNVIGWSTAVASTLENKLDQDVRPWVVTMPMPVAIVSCILAGPITMRFGPRKSLLAFAFPMIAGWILLFETTNMWFALAGRSLCGIANGGTMVLIPLYVSEIVEISLRGRLGSLMSFCLFFGVLLAYSLGGLLDSRGVAIFCGIIPIIFLVVFYLCPESPTFLFSNGKESDAIETLRRLRGSEEEVTTEINAMRAAGKLADTSKPNLRDLVRGRAARKAGIITIGVLACAQVSGIAPMMYYTGTIFMNAGGDMSPIIASCIIAAVQLSGCFVASILMDKAGRRTLMLFSCSVMSLSHAFSGYAMMPNTLAPSWTPVVSISVYILAYALGAGPAPYVIVSEVSAPRLKALACSVALTFNQMLSFTIAKIFPDLIYYMGYHGVFWLFGSFCATSTIFCWFFLLETSGKTSARIQAELEGNKVEGPEV